MSDQDRLCCDGRIVAPVEVARSLGNRTRGLLGRDGIDGAMWIAPAKSIHTFGMRFAIDVAFVARDGTVVRTMTVAPWRMTRTVWRAAAVVEAEAGMLARWGIERGSRVEVQTAPPPDDDAPD